MSIILGEYIYDGHQLHNANNDVSMGHEDIIRQTICSEYAEQLVKIAKELKSPELNPLITQIQQFINSGDYNHPYVFDLYQKIQRINSSLVANPELREAMIALMGDPRKYGCQKLGYIIIRNNNFEVYELNQKTAEEIVDAIYEILAPDMDLIDEQDIMNQEITVWSYKTNTSRDYKVEDLKEGNIFKTATAALTSANMPSHHPKSIQGWQRMYTSEALSFREWLKVNYS